jgi:hypothetical protein
MLYITISLELTKNSLPSACKLCSIAEAQPETLIYGWLMGFFPMLITGFVSKDKFENSELFFRFYSNSISTTQKDDKICPTHFIKSSNLLKIFILQSVSYLFLYFMLLLALWFYLWISTQCNTLVFMEHLMSGSSYLFYPSVFCSIFFAI